MAVTRNDVCWPACRQHRGRNVDSIEGGPSTGCRRHRGRVALIPRGVVYWQRECISHDNEYNTATPARQVISIGLYVYLLTSMSNDGRHKFYFEQDIKCSRTMVVLRNNLWWNALLSWVFLAVVPHANMRGFEVQVVWKRESWPIYNDVLDLFFSARCQNVSKCVWCFGFYLGLMFRFLFYLQYMTIYENTIGVLYFVWGRCIDVFDFFSICDHLWEGFK